MRIFLAIGISLCMLVSGAQSQTSKEQTIRIVRSASQPSRQGPVENFTGSVRVDPLFQAIAPARASGSLVTFEPGARTAWHTPAGPNPDRDDGHGPGAALGRLYGTEFRNSLEVPPSPKASRRKVLVSQLHVRCRTRQRAMYSPASRKSL